MTRLLRTLKGKYSFCIRDIAKMLKQSKRNAERYLAMMKEVDAIELRYRGTDRYYYYRVRRIK